MASPLQFVKKLLACMSDETFLSTLASINFKTKFVEISSGYWKILVKFLHHSYNLTNTDEYLHLVRTCFLNRLLSVSETKLKSFFLGQLQESFLSFKNLLPYIHSLSDESFQRRNVLRLRRLHYFENKAKKYYLFSLRMNQSIVPPPPPEVIEPEIAAQDPETPSPPTLEELLQNPEFVAHRDQTLLITRYSASNPADALRQANLVSYSSWTGISNNEEIQALTDFTSRDMLDNNPLEPERTIFPDPELETRTRTILAEEIISDERRIASDITRRNNRWLPENSQDFIDVTQANIDTQRLNDRLSRLHTTQGAPSMSSSFIEGSNTHFHSHQIVELDNGYHQVENLFNENESDQDVDFML